MTVYSYAQLETLWINAGGPKTLAPVAAAIGEAESGGNSDALNPNDNGGRQSSYGIWQISNGTHSPPSASWANPAVNAQLAVAKWKGAKGFSPWGTYTSGAYKPFMSAKTTPDPNVPGSPTQTMAETAAAGGADCLLGFGGLPGTSFIGDIFGGGGNVGSFCMFTKSEARAVLAIGSIMAGASFLLVGFALTVVMAGPGRRIIQLVMPVARAAGRMPKATAPASVASA